MSHLQRYSELIARGECPGRFDVLPFVSDIAELVVEFKPRSILHYACGLGIQYTRERAHVVWGDENKYPALYDPAVAQFSKRPEGRFDGVICVGVLDHAAPEEFEAFMRDIAGYAQQWAFIATRSAKDLTGYFPPSVTVVVRRYGIG